MEIMLAAAGAKIVLALVAFLAMRLSLALLDKALMFDFKEWINKMEEEHPEKLVVYLGCRLIAMAILFAWIFG